MFRAEKLPPGYHYTFGGKFSELDIAADDGTRLNALLFTADSSKGVILYLHGNAGSLAGWGEVAARYTALHYDVFIPDYRGYGKSGGGFKKEQQLFGDAQKMYDELRKIYPESKIVVLGYSLGSGLAAYVAAHNHPKMLILQAPYYSMTDLMKQHYSWLPAFILKYKLATYKMLPEVTCPVVIFHGDDDRVISYNSALRLKALLKPGDRFITLKGQGHGGITDNPDYIRELGVILEK